MSNLCGKCPQPQEQKTWNWGRGRPWNKILIPGESVLAATDQGTTGKDVGAPGAKL